MKISKVTINNFRSINYCEINFNDMVILLGHNNHGKSNILRAIEFALTTSMKLSHEDIFAQRREDDTDVWVEITFDNLEDNEKQIYNKYLLENDTFCMRKTANFDDDGKCTISYNGYINAPLEEWLQSSNASNYTTRDLVNQTPLCGYVPASGRLTRALIENAQNEYINDHEASLIFDTFIEDGPLLGNRTIPSGIFPDFFLIPAVRDLTEEEKVNNSALFGKLISQAISEMTTSESTLRQVQEDLSNLVSIFNSSPDNESRPIEINSLESSIQEGLVDWDVEVSIEVVPPSIDQIFKTGTNIHLDDGIRTSAKNKGHGLQRALIFALIKAWSQAIRRTRAEDESTSSQNLSDSIIFAVEEPELFLHPSAQRTLYQALRSLSVTSNNQVIVCSHSTHFVDLDNYNDIILVKKKSVQEGTKVLQCNIDLFEGGATDDRKRRFHMAAWLNPDRGEMLFAKKVIFVEGETEKTVFPYLAKKLGCHSESVYIVDCGSKYNFTLYISIANAFKLNYIVVHDVDPLPDPIPADWDRGKIRSKRKTFNLNAEIAASISGMASSIAINPDFEIFSGVSKNQGQKKGKALAAIEYFEETDVDTINKPLKTVVKYVYSNYR